MTLTSSIPYNTNCIWSPDSHKLILVTGNAKWKDEPSVVLNLIDVKDKKITKLKEGYYQTDSLFFSPDGQKLAMKRQPFSGDQRTGIKPPFPENGPPLIEIIDLHTQKTASLPATDIIEIIGWTADNKGLIVTKQNGTKKRLYGSDIATAALSLKDFPSMTVINNAVLSKNQKYIALAAESLYQPREIYFTKADEFSPKKITSVNRNIDLSSIRAHSLKWKSADNLDIEGILVYPQNHKPGQQFPLLVSIHGGPTSAESEFFIGRPWCDHFSPAVLASLGYGVLVVNYRGSTGYGEKFQKLNYKDMGGGDFQDILSGVDHLIGQGLADPNKLFISGSSYGGFMSAWIVTQTDRFKAAIVSAGIVDWISDIGTTDYPTPMEAILGGYYWDEYDLWRQTSPLSHINHVKTPVLILQGRADERVETSQAQQLYNALRHKKIPCRLISYQYEGHNLSDPEAAKDAMEEIIRWVGKHGGGEPPPATTLSKNH